MAAVSTMPPGGDYSDYQDDDGYFTCAVSVQHKVRQSFLIALLHFIATPWEGIEKYQPFTGDSGFFCHKYIL